VGRADCGAAMVGRAPGLADVGDAIAGRTAAGRADLGDAIAGRTAPGPDVPEFWPVGVMAGAATDIPATGACPALVRVAVPTSSRLPTQAA